MTPQEISRIIVEKGEGVSSLDNPDFSLFENLPRLLKMAEKEDIDITIDVGFGGSDLTVQTPDHNYFKAHENVPIDQIPLLLATDIARILKEGTHD